MKVTVYSQVGMNREPIVGFDLKTAASVDSLLTLIVGKEVRMKERYTGGSIEWSIEGGMVLVIEEGA